MPADAERFRSENPFASPRYRGDQFAGDVSEDSESKDLRAFVGPNADYYLPKWLPRTPGSRASSGFNWAAFFLSGFWLPYRKMYRLAFILYAIVLVESTLESLVFVTMLGEPAAPEWVNHVITLLVAAVCGKYGNRWYLSHATKAISEVRAEGLESEDLWQRLSRRGGTNLAASLGMFALFVAVLIVWIELFETPQPLGGPVQIKLNQ
jgi:hypothetical protein